MRIFLPNADPPCLKSTTQSAEDVMNAYVEAFKNRDFEGMRSLD